VNLTDRIHTFLGRRHESFLSKGILWRLACLLFLAALVTSGTKGAEVQPRPVPSAGPGLKFAIADLDGDLRPDLAYVETGRSDVSLTDYWIQLQVTTAQRQTILVVAPTGGLEIVARDVNGDHAPDLVLTTAWLKQPVAILLNDGHGIFSQADPRAFPDVFREPGANWDSSAQQALDAIGFPPQPRVGGYSTGMRLPRPRSLVDDVPRSECGLLLFLTLASHPGRAPPSELPSL
jgi:hypothetical protein